MHPSLFQCLVCGKTRSDPPPRKIPKSPFCCASACQSGGGETDLESRMNHESKTDVELNSPGKKTKIKDKKDKTINAQFFLKKLTLHWTKWRLSESHASCFHFREYFPPQIKLEMPPPPPSTLWVPKGDMPYLERGSEWVRERERERERDRSCFSSSYRTLAWAAVFFMGCVSASILPSPPVKT